MYIDKELEDYSYSCVTRKSPQSQFVQGPNYRDGGLNRAVRDKIQKLSDPFQRTFEIVLSLSSLLRSGRGGGFCVNHVIVGLLVSVRGLSEVGELGSLPLSIVSSHV